MAGNSKSGGQSLPPQVLIVLELVLVVAVFAVGWFGIYSPAEDMNIQAKRKLVQQEQKLEEAKQQEAEYEHYRRASERLERRLSDLKAKIPSTVDELNHFLASISQRARSSRVSKWTLYKQEGNIPRDGYEAVPIRMEFVATYEATLQFFWDLANMGDNVQNSSREQLVNIRDVEITKDRSARGEDAALTYVRVSCVAETYLYTANAAKSSAGKNANHSKK